MSLTQSILPALAAVDDIVGDPDGLDLIPTSVAIVTRTWTNGARGRGGPDAYTESSLPLPRGVTVRHLTTREVAGSGGTYEQGDLLVGPIRPPFTDPNGQPGGFTEEQIRPVVRTQGVQILWRLTPTRDGGSGIAGDYQLVEFRRDSPYYYEVVIGRERTTP